MQGLIWKGAKWRMVTKKAANIDEDENDSWEETDGTSVTKNGWSQKPKHYFIDVPN